MISKMGDWNSTELLGRRRRRNDDLSENLSYFENH